MSVTAVATHPILGAVATARAALGEVADVQPIFMSTTEKQAAGRVRTARSASGRGPPPGARLRR